MKCQQQLQNIISRKRKRQPKIQNRKKPVQKIRQTLRRINPQIQRNLNIMTPMVNSQNQENAINADKQVTFSKIAKIRQFSNFFATVAAEQIKLRQNAQLVRKLRKTPKGANRATPVGPRRKTYIRNLRFNCGKNNEDGKCENRYSIC